MARDRVSISQADRLGLTYRVRSVGVALGKLVFDGLNRRKLAVVETDNRSIELRRGGQDLQFCTASESGRRRALMMVYLPRRVRSDRRRALLRLQGEGCGSAASAG